MKPDAWKLISVSVATVVVAVLYFYVTSNDPKRHRFVTTTDKNFSAPLMYFPVPPDDPKDNYSPPTYIIPLRAPLTSRPPSN